MPWFGRFNSYFGTPVRVNVMSGIVSTIFMLAALEFSTGSNANTFTVVLYLATSTTLLSYLLIFPTVIKLRYNHPHVHRPYRLPFGMAGVWISGVLCTAWMLLGSWAGRVPRHHRRVHLRPPLQRARQLRGLARAIRSIHARNFGVVVLVGVVGYWLGKPVREREVDVPIEALSPAAGD